MAAESSKCEEHGLHHFDDEPCFYCEKKLCAKCKQNVPVAIYVEWSESFPLCKLCADVLESYPETNRMRVHDFIEGPQNTIEQNMEEARYARTKGKGPWQK